MIENERSFLVARSPDLAGIKGISIEQRYLPVPGSALRIRRADGEHVITRKVPVRQGDLSRHHEVDMPISMAEFAALTHSFPRTVTKERFRIPIEGSLVAELDVFREALAGFVKVEVEFPDEASRRAFSPPPWFGREITDEPWAKNMNLAGKAFKEIRRYLTNA